MSAQIFRHDDRPESDPGVNPQGPPILGFPRAAALRSQPRPRPSQSATATAPRAASPSDTSAALPSVVLELPELTAEKALDTGRAILSANLISWIVIALGALLAMALIWTAPKSSPRVVDDAPSWDMPGGELRVRQATAPVEQARIQPSPANEAAARATESGTPAADGQPSPAPYHGLQPAEPNDVNSRVATEGTGAQVDVPGESPLAATSAPAEVETARAARAPEGTWDGRSPSARPGEAVPVGRIINVAVPQ